MNCPQTGFRIFALSGLTECGKLTAAKYFNELGMGAYKIGDVLKIVQDKERNPAPFQDWNFSAELERPGWLIRRFHEELISLMRCDLVANSCIESLYGPVMARELVKVAGAQVVIVYIDSDYDVRLRRQAAQLGTSSLADARKVLDEKDAYKISKGNLAVRDMAHAIINNSSTIDHFRRELRGVVDSFAIHQQNLSHGK